MLLYGTVVKIHISFPISRLKFITGKASYFIKARDGSALQAPHRFLPALIFIR
jgi:hypothetical protein